MNGLETEILGHDLTTVLFNVKDLSVNNRKKMSESKSFARQVFPRYAPLLGKRAGTLSKIFVHLESTWTGQAQKDPSKMTLIEIGSTVEVFLDAFANFWGGRVIVVDRGESRGEGDLPASRTKLVKEDSLKFLSEYKEDLPCLLYFSTGNPLQRLKEFFAIKDSLHGSLVVVEDRETAKGIDYFLSRFKYTKLIDVPEGEVGWWVDKPMPKVLNLIAWDNGIFGLAQDIEVIKGLLESSSGPDGSEDGKTPGFHVVVKEGNFLNEFDYADVNIFNGDVHPMHFQRAGKNVSIPNIEYYFERWMEYLPYFTKILYKVKCAEEQLWKGDNVLHLGWTSVDRYIPALKPRPSGLSPVVVKDYHSFLHIAGESPAKQTDVILDTWRRYPDLPGVTVLFSGAEKHKVDISGLPPSIHLVTQKVTRNEVTRLMNTYALHLCPSKTEGFGHYINEARSCKAVIVTTDGPPMNELIDEKTGFLVKYSSKGKFNRADTFVITPEDLYQTLKKVLHLTLEEKKEMGERARERYLSEKKEFELRVGKLKESLLEGLNTRWITNPLLPESAKFETIKKLRETSQHDLAYKMLHELDLPKTNDYIRNFGYYDEIAIVGFYVGGPQEAFDAFENVWRLNATTPTGRSILREHFHRLKGNSVYFDLSKFSGATKEAIRGLREEFGPDIDEITKRF